MDDTDLIERSQAKDKSRGESAPPELIQRPVAPAPSKDDSPEERENWASFFVPWFMSVTGGEWPEPIEDEEGRGPIGRRWRYEYFHCVGDPQAFEEYAEREIAVFNGKE